MSSATGNGSTAHPLLALCAEIAGKNAIAAACECGRSVYSRSHGEYDLLVVIDDYPEGLRYHTRKANDQPATILATDKSLIELDARSGAMGEFIIERLLTPYNPLHNEELLSSIEVDAKERILHEELKELVLEYGEMSRELLIQQEYLSLVRIRKRAKVFLPAAKTYAALLHKSVRDSNIRKMAPGYGTAISQLISQGVLRRDGSGYALGDSFVDRALVAKSKSTTRAINIVGAGRRTLQAYLAHGRAAYLTPDVLTRELVSSLEQSLLGEVETGGLEDPKRYLFLKTATGQVNLAERFSIQSFAARFRPGVVVTVSPLGSVINEVYLITAGNERLVAKKFTEWSRFKWFTLGLVSLGTRFFSVSGKARLENEYATNRFLSRRGVHVPEILHVSVPDRVLVQRYIEGSSLVELVKRAVSSESIPEADVAAVSNVGATLAKIHVSGVTIGDSKPENFQLGTDGEVYSLDLEQAKKSGDKAWDIAEFLYYSGHYVFPNAPSEGFREYVNAFIDGYQRKGNEAVLKRAAGVRYSRVFSLWTPPLAVLEVSKALRGVH